MEQQTTPSVLPPKTPKQTQPIMPATPSVMKQQRPVGRVGDKSQPTTHTKQQQTPVPTTAATPKSNAIATFGSCHNNTSSSSSSAGATPKKATRPPSSASSSGSPSPLTAPSPSIGNSAAIIHEVSQLKRHLRVIAKSMDDMIANMDVLVERIEQLEEEVWRPVQDDDDDAKIENDYDEEAQEEEEEAGLGLVASEYEVEPDEDNEEEYHRG